jgi:hypothetical protein
MPRLAVAGLAALTLTLSCGRAQVAFCERPLPPDAPSKETNCAHLQVSTDKRTYPALNAVVKITVAGHVAFVPCMAGAGACGQTPVQVETEQGALIWRKELFAVPCAAGPPRSVGDQLGGEAVTSPLNLPSGVYRVVGQGYWDFGRSYFRVC